MENFDYFCENTKKNIEDFYDYESKKSRIYPVKSMIFRAFKLCPLNDLKVVIIGQDPYSHEGQANGLAFSVNNGVLFPPSLKNIFKEIENEFGNIRNRNGDLEYLAKQGVLLINSILTVKENNPLSHDNDLYKKFFEEVISNIEKKDDCVVYMLWGNNAKKIKKYIHNKNHFIIENNHPSPLSANRGGWFNKNQFKECNDILKKHSLKEIMW